MVVHLGFFNLEACISFPGPAPFISGPFGFLGTETNRPAEQSKSRVETAIWQSDCFVVPHPFIQINFIIHMVNSF